MFYDDTIEINDLNVSALALESSLVLDMFTSDDDEDVAMEAEFSVIKDKNSKSQSYTASIGNKTYYDQSSKTDTFKRKFGYTVKKVWRAMLVGIINFFKAIGNGMRKILQVILIPMNALIMAAAGTPETKLLAGFTREQKQIWDVLSKRAKREISDVGREVLGAIEKRVDKVLALTEKVSTFTEKVAVNAGNYDMKTDENGNKIPIVIRWLAKSPEEKKFRELTNELSENEAKFKHEEAKLNLLLNRVEKSREAIKVEAAKLGIYYKDAVVRYMFITKEECNNAIRKCKDIIKFSGDRIRDCERLQQCENVSSDAKLVADLYQKTASFSNSVVRYYGLTLSKFGVRNRLSKASSK